MIYSLCAIAYFDLIFNPKKGFHFIPFFNKFQIPIVVLMIISLLGVITLELPENKFSPKIREFKKYYSPIFLICLFLIFNEVFFIFHYYQKAEFHITAILAIPIPLIASDLFISSKIKCIYILFFGLLLTIPTFLYFHFIYTTYEDYWFGIPIVYMHFWIRNWLIFIGLNLILIYCLVTIKSRQTFEVNEL